MQGPPPFGGVSPFSLVDHQTKIITDLLLHVRTPYVYVVLSCYVYRHNRASAPQAARSIWRIWRQFVVLNHLELSSMIDKLRKDKEGEVTIAAMTMLMRWRY